MTGRHHLIEHLDRSGAAVRTLVRDEAGLASLQQASGLLTESFGWPPALATHFVLTGEPP